MKETEKGIQNHLACCFLKVPTHRHPQNLAVWIFGSFSQNYVIIRFVVSFDISETANFTKKMALCVSGGVSKSWHPFKKSIVLFHAKLHSISIVGGFSPFEKYESKWESSPRLGVKIKNMWNHHLDFRFWGIPYHLGKGRYAPIQLPFPRPKKRRWNTSHFLPISSTAALNGGWNNDPNFKAASQNVGIYLSDTPVLANESNLNYLIKLRVARWWVSEAHTFTKPASTMMASYS